MTTTYSNPKEMLGYLVVKFIERQLEVLPLIPYDRRSVFAFYYQIKGLDSQLQSFRSDMFLYDYQTNEKIYYSDCMVEIQKMIETNWSNVYAKDYEDFLQAIYKWSELIASAYPKLGLVPETGEITRAHREDNILEADPNEPIPNENPSEPDSIGEPEQIRISNPLSSKKPEPSRPAPRQKLRFV